MPRHESVADEFIADLRKGAESEAERIKAAKGAPNWAQAQQRMGGGTRPYEMALNRVEEGWTREDIERELRNTRFLSERVTSVIEPKTREGEN